MTIVLTPVWTNGVQKLKVEPGRTFHPSFELRPLLTRDVL